MAVDDPGEHIGEIAEWLDVVELAGFDQQGNDGLITDVLQFRLHPCAIIRMSSRSPDRKVSCAPNLDSGHQSGVLRNGATRLRCQAADIVLDLVKLRDADHLQGSA